MYSFGILLWELFSHGGKPFAGMQNQEVLDEVKKGYQMPKPQNCPEEIYQIMKKCWNLNPEERPSFEELFETLDLQTNEPNTKSTGL